MKNLKDKFKKNINFVKPLYKKVNPKPNAHTNLSEYVTIDIDNKEKLCGNGIAVKNHIAKEKRNIITVFHKNSTEKYNVVVPIIGGDSLRNTSTEKVASLRRSEAKVTKMIGIAESAQTKHSSTNKFLDTWLRVYPAPILPNESVYSIIFRCLTCQMGLSTFLLLWTLFWMLVIHHFEGPFETKVSEDFKRAQNQLVIDLATELRQITPLSPKWRAAIEDRIEAERQLTIAAVGRGARLHPGHFWDVPGTFLFTVYVMTALGFGAPVPQSVWGRTVTLIYAVIAVPIHIYLMVNLSSCVIVNVEYCIHRLRMCRRGRPSFNVGRNLDYNKESPNCSRNSELKPNKCKFRERLTCIVCACCMGRGVPLAMLVYYILGAGLFGIARSKQPLEAAMFPLEFTTTGGLEHVECYVRIVYGIYVEGAMVLLSCALATLRRHSSHSARKMADQYRLFAQERQHDEEE